jgi:ferredoxin
MHVLSGEVMLITAAFLFCRTRLNTLKCTGCASCESSCLTGSLFFRDEENIRTFFYSMCRCICCGSCVRVCPEEAAELRHEISVRQFFRSFSTERMHSLKLAVCQRCGALFSTEPLLSSVDKAITDEYRYLCSNCKKSRLAIDFYTLAPWEKTLQEGPKGHNTSAGAELIS